MAQIFGSAQHRDGSKVNGTMTISTSWNGKVAYPRGGEYCLDLGSNPRQKITIYVDGMIYREIFVDGNVRVDVRA